MLRIRSRVVTCFGVVLLASAPAVVGGTSAAGAAEVVIYSARHYGQEAAFEAFTKKTGIQLRILNGNTGELFERLKAEGDKTPADVLLTVDAGNLWNAARAGLLARTDSPELQANIPAHLRDPESRWVGLTVRARTIMYNTKKVQPSELSTYEALGDPKWKGRLCLRTSGYIYNQSLLATMIKRQGEAKSEAIVRGWVANRANAIKFLEFLSSPEAQQMFADLSFEYPANPQAAIHPLVVKWGKFNQDDINIASAGEFQATAVKLADRAGYK